MPDIQLQDNGLFHMGLYIDQSTTTRTSVAHIKGYAAGVGYLPGGLLLRQQAGDSDWMVLPGPTSMPILHYLLWAKVCDSDPRDHIIPLGYRFWPVPV